MKRLFKITILIVMIMLVIVNVVYATSNYYQGTQTGSYVSEENTGDAFSINGSFESFFRILRIGCVVFICLSSYLAYVAVRKKEKGKVILFLIVICILVFIACFLKILVNG